MISFIIIGRNESWKLTKCFESVFKTIEYNQLNEHEVIYVDSQSTDDSVDRALRFQDVRIFKITGDINAALARNVGAVNATGETLFFIDGDMEIKPDFLHYVFDPTKGFKNKFISGQHYDIVYDKNGKILVEGPYYNNLTVEVKATDIGGLFIISKHIWELGGGMRESFSRSQDIDFSLRLGMKNIFCVRHPELMATHHTIHYKGKTEKWYYLFKGYELYSRSLLYRKNLFNRYMYKRLFRNDYTVLILLLGTCFFDLWGMIIYLSTIFIKSVKKSSSKLILDDILYFISRDIITIIGFILFWPPNKRVYSVELIR